MRDSRWRVRPRQLVARAVEKGGLEDSQLAVGSGACVSETSPGWHASESPPKRNKGAAPLGEQRQQCEPDGRVPTIAVTSMNVEDHEMLTDYRTAEE